jgi:peptidoglycan hydrolase-like protein with peptidoglycan-binding domain
MASFIRPIAGSPRITDDFDEHVARKSVNPGTDYAVGRGTQVLSPAAGTVKVADANPGGAGGRLVVVYFDNGWSGDFLHLSRLSVTVGQRVDQGTLLGLTGASANGSDTGVGAHLHYTLRNRQVTSLSNAGNVDPEEHLGGDSSQDVKNRQAWLNESRGAGLTVDGIMGPKTKAAIRSYQEFLRDSYGYRGAIDGIWGDGTQAAHQGFWNDRHKAPAPAPSTGSGSLRDVQQKLKTNYPLYAGRLVVDGIDGPNTRAAVKEFQRRSGLTVDGIAGPATRKKLGL